jgi:adenylyltransferase/sulfurtransferase
MDFARYSRQLALPGFGVDAQARLRAARVLVIGAGGLGSSVIPTLAGAGVGTLGIVDDDTVELSNLHRQHIHGVDDIGRRKVDSAADAVAALDPGVVVEPHAARLTAADALDLFARYDLVLDGSDNFATRYLANDAAVLTDIPLVWGAVAQYGGQVGVSWASRGPHYRDLFPAPPAPGTVLSCEEGGVLPTVVGVVGSLMATEAIKIITGVGRPLVGRVTVFDGLTGTFRELEYERDPDGEAITALADYDAFCGVPSGAAAAADGAGVAKDAEDTDDPGSVSPRVLASLLGEDITLIDVREPWEVEIGALPGAVAAPLGGLEDALDGLDRSRPVIVYCHHGIRSARARDLLVSRGFDASHLDGGIDAWSRDVDATVARY